MMNCPDCTKSFDTTHGLAIHHGQVHDSALPDDIDTSLDADHREAVINSDTTPGMNDEMREQISDSLSDRQFDPEHRAKISESLSGSNHPNWQGGKSLEPYPEGWNNDLREFIRELYSRTCQLCGVHESELDRRLSVHHWDEDKQNIMHDNLFPFCKSCHQRLHRSLNGGDKRGVVAGS